ncbi:methyltransferase domain-containing protein [Cryptosporangium minutisporangium]|uniref:Methyltransferase domain-containing protein n=1 Tax=Cryptosporangium minutisporangium TaxID=113569 RepID=A0ABP6SRD1_9ACTN
METTPRDTYIYDQQWQQERARQAGLAANFDATTTRHLASLGVTNGWRCLEAGAGAGSVARWLAETVGPSGRVTATDRDTRFLDDLVGQPPVEVVRHDVTTDPIEPGAYDLVHARALVEHVADRAAVVATLASALRPGGILLLEDVVFGGPATQAFARVTRPAAIADAMYTAFHAVSGGFRAIGADPEYGLELPAALRAAGLVDVDAELTYRLVRGDSPEAAFYQLTLSQLAPRLIDAGLLTPQQSEQVIGATSDPDAQWLSIGLTSAWGRVPA